MLFLFNDTATTEIYTLSLHDALPIFLVFPGVVLHEGAHYLACLLTRTRVARFAPFSPGRTGDGRLVLGYVRSEEHTSELQSRQYLVCRLLLGKKIKKSYKHTSVSSLV